MKTKDILRRLLKAVIVAISIPFVLIIGVIAAILALPYWIITGNSVELLIDKLSDFYESIWPDIF